MRFLVRAVRLRRPLVPQRQFASAFASISAVKPLSGEYFTCLLYTSDAADDLLCVDLGGRRIIKKKNNIKLSNSRLLKMTNTLYDECKLNDIDYRLVLAIIKVESNFRHNITSRDGSKGLMQLKPSLAKFIAKNNGIDYKSSKDLQEPDKNIRIGTFHISKLIDDFENIHQALFAYNVGQKKAKGKIFEEDEPLTPFTKKVMKEYRKNISILPEQ